MYVCRDTDRLSLFSVSRQGKEEIDSFSAATQISAPNFLCRDCKIYFGHIKFNLYVGFSFSLTVFRA